MKDFLKELEQIIETKDDNQFLHSQTRKRLLDQFIAKWIIEIKASQSVINQKHMTSEFRDFILNKLAQDCNEELIEQVMDFTFKEKRIQGKILAIRKSPK